MSINGMAADDVVLKRLKWITTKMDDNFKKFILPLFPPYGTSKSAMQVIAEALDSISPPPPVGVNPGGSNNSLRSLLESNPNLWTYTFECKTVFSSFDFKHNTNIKDTLHAICEADKSFTLVYMIHTLLSNKLTVKTIIEMSRDDLLRTMKTYVNSGLTPHLQELLEGVDSGSASQVKIENKRPLIDSGSAPVKIEPTRPSNIKYKKARS